MPEPLGHLTFADDKTLADQLRYHHKELLKMARGLRERGYTVQVVVSARAKDRTDLTGSPQITLTTAL